MKLCNHSEECIALFDAQWNLIEVQWCVWLGDSDNFSIVDFSTWHSLFSSSYSLANVSRANIDFYFVSDVLVGIIFVFCHTITNQTALDTYFTFKWRWIWSFFSICSIGYCATSYGAEISFGNRSSFISGADNADGDSLPIEKLNGFH